MEGREWLFTLGTSQLAMITWNAMSLVWDGRNEKIVYSSKQPTAVCLSVKAQELQNDHIFTDQLVLLVSDLIRSITK